MLLPDDENADRSSETATVLQSTPPCLHNDFCLPIQCWNTLLVRIVEILAGGL